jgi:cold shock CspA family protein
MSATALERPPSTLINKSVLFLFVSRLQAVESMFGTSRRLCKLAPRACVAAPNVATTTLRDFASGTVTFTGKGRAYGFITPDGSSDTKEDDVFWAADDIPVGVNYLKRGDNVEYDEVPNESKPGKLRAVNIRGGTGKEKLSLAE